MQYRPNLIEHLKNYCRMFYIYDGESSLKIAFIDLYNKISYSPG